MNNIESNLNFTSIEQAVDAFNKLFDFLKKEHRIEKSIDLAQVLAPFFPDNPKKMDDPNKEKKKVEAVEGRISRSQTCTKNTRLNEVTDLIHKITVAFGIEKESGTGAWQFTAQSEKSLQAPINPHLRIYAGIYFANFFRSTSNQLGAIALLILPTGRAYFRTDMTKKQLNDSDTEGLFDLLPIANLLLGNFTAKDNTYSLNFILKGNYNQEQLEGTFAGYASFLNNNPMASTIIFHRQEKWENNDNVLFKNYRSIDLPTVQMDDNNLSEIFNDKGDDLRFYLGNYEPNVSIIYPSVKFFQDIKLVPNFENFTNSDLAGNYIMYRLSSDKNLLLGRPCQFLANGTARFIGTRLKPHNIYWGRYHIFESCLALSLDRRTNNDGSRERVHRIHYIFKLNLVESHAGIRHLFGKSCIINLNERIMVGDEVLVAVPEKDINKVQAISKSVSFTEELTPFEQQILTYLQKGISTETDNVPNGAFVQKTDFGLIFFKCACYEAKNKKIKAALEHFKQALKHGFNDINLLKRELELKTGMLESITAFIKIDGQRIILQEDIY